TYAAPHHLVADDGLINWRRTPGGDAWESANDSDQTAPGAVQPTPASAPVPAPGPVPVSFGRPGS
ncbi:MAG: tRNA (N6-isopentenyl adenosine(37)-C2)-methylthiotransferase MiaB, partial [Propionibacteriaceae bacterium]|nr:tRNA (N6-isopentenyl adenosine(37)-C2)-methylthiotransferase MiaB [Propionibacteriaceae bacterium]